MPLLRQACTIVSTAPTEHPRSLPLQASTSDRSKLLSHDELRGSLTGILDGERSRYLMCHLFIFFLDSRPNRFLDRKTIKTSWPHRYLARKTRKISLVIVASFEGLQCCEVRVFSCFRGWGTHSKKWHRWYLFLDRQSHRAN